MLNSTPGRETDRSGLDAASWHHVALSVIGDAVLVTDADGRITSMNRIAESLTGWNAEEAVGNRLETVFRILNEATREPSAQPVRKLLDAGLVPGLASHTLLIARDGSEIPIEDRAAPVWGEAGAIVGVVTVFRDITERRWSEHRIESARGFAESIVDTVRQPLLILTADLLVKSANRIFYEIFQVEPTKTIGRSIYDLGDGQWNIASLRELCETIIPHNGIVEDFEIEHHFETIGQKSLLLNARRFPAEGKWDLILLAIADNSAGKQLEMEREGMLRAAEAARDKAEADATKLADADRHKNQFLAMLAHELRNPIAAVRNAVEVATRSGSKADLEWSRDVTARQVGNFAHLINDLLDVARIAEGKIQLHKELIDATPIIRHAVEAVRPLIDERQHELVVAYASKDLRLEADSTRLEQILVNLLTNAAMYTPPGGHILLKVGVERGEIVFRVRDDGLGILPELLPTIFDLFTQGDRSLDRSEGGLGIGLSLVRSLAELHGGTVTANSDGPGTGSEFVLRLAAARGRTVVESPMGGNPPAPKLRRARVLVVDDNSDTANGMARLLTLSGHESRVAQCAEDALGIAREFRPEVMLLDIGLPGMDGYALASALRREEWSKGSLIVAVSGHGEAEARDRSKAAGFHQHLIKPVNFDAILALIVEKGSGTELANL